MCGLWVDLEVRVATHRPPPPFDSSPSATGQLAAVCQQRRAAVRLVRSHRLPPRMICPSSVVVQVWSTLAGHVGLKIRGTLEAAMHHHPALGGPAVGTQRLRRRLPPLVARLGPKPRLRAIPPAVVPHIRRSIPAQPTARPQCHFPTGFGRGCASTQRRRFAQAGGGGGGADPALAAELAANADALCGTVRRAKGYLAAVWPAGACAGGRISPRD